MRYEFDTSTPPKLRVGLAGGRIEIDTADAAQTVVEVEAIRGDLENLRVEQRGDTIAVEHRKRFALVRGDEYEIRIVAPHGVEADLDVASADARLSGRIGGVEVNSASGDIQIERVERDARIRSASGDVRLLTVGGRADVNTASGDIELGSVGGDVSARSASGDVHVDDAAGSVSINTASGDQTITAVAAGKVDLKSASGDVRVGVRRGSRIFVDARSMSGETRSDLELGGSEPEGEGPLVELKAATMSGDISIVRA
jgi:DUF4097 and DUF4098 domain-containing protein YvlB